MTQAIDDASGLVAGLIGGLLAQNWIWALVCTLFIYAGLRVARKFWHKLRTGPAGMLRAIENATTTVTPRGAQSIGTDGDSC